MTSPDIWVRAGAAIDKTFGVDIRYTGAGVVDKRIRAIRGDFEAPNRDNSAKTLRSIVFEIDQADVAERPTGRDTFVAGNVRWRVQSVERRDDLGKWELGAKEDGTV